MFATMVTECSREGCVDCLLCLKPGQNNDGLLWRSGVAFNNMSPIDPIFCVVMETPSQLCALSQHKVNIFPGPFIAADVAMYDIL